MPPSRYNIRVYGLLLNENRQVLVTDEYRMGTLMTKFPGGGNHFGEGFSDTLIREWEEELSIEVTIGSLFYINDFPVVSAFNSKEQIVAIYYFVETPTPSKIPISTVPFDFENKEGAQAFRWISLDKISRKDFTFPIDKKVGDLLSLSQK